jgi:hypothetical protein
MLDLIKACRIETAQTAVKGILDSCTLGNEAFSGFALIGSEGTRKVSSLLISEKLQDFLTHDEMRILFDVLKDKTKEERIVHDIPKTRADIFPFGFLII